jgi:hypothetical protein
MDRCLAIWILRTMSIFVLIMGTSAVLKAQYLVSAKAGLIQYVEGDASVDGKRLQIPKENAVQMDNGQSLRTGMGRAEMLLSPEVYLRLDENSLLRMERNQIREAHIALEQGTAFVETVEEIKGNKVRIKVGADIIEIKEAGLYRICAAPGELRVYGGSALVTGNSKKTAIKNGKSILLNKVFTVASVDVNVADSFHQWSARRSFDLFIATERSRRQTHWQPISMGWVANSSYHMRFYSRLFFDRWNAQRKKETAEEAIKAALEASAEDQARAAREALEAIKRAREAGEEPQIPVR